jgi:hypothetical protein
MIIRTAILCAPLIHLSLGEASAHQTLPKQDRTASIHSQGEVLSKELEAKKKALTTARAAEKDPAKNGSVSFSSPARAPG